jgi:hypothetical protein
MHSHRTSSADAIPTLRSKVTNGSRLLQNVDGRSSSARRFRDLVRAYEAEAGGVLTEVERGLIKQAAGLTLRSEQMQSAIVRGEAIDNDALIRISGEARRILSSIVTRAAKRKPAPPTLADYLARRKAADALEASK